MSGTVAGERQQRGIEARQPTARPDRCAIHYRAANSSTIRGDRDSPAEGLQGCQCACGRCTVLHYIPIPKTASESTKRLLASSPIAGRYRDVAACRGKTLCYVNPGTHEMNSALPPVHPATPLPFSSAWWHFAHVSHCSVDSRHRGQEGNVVRFATIRDPYDRFLSTFVADAQAGRLRPFGIPRTPPGRALDADPRPLLANRTAMRQLLGGAVQQHYLPASGFLVDAREDARVHVLLRFSHLAEDFGAMLHFFRIHGPALVHGSPLPSVDFKRVHTNDPVKGTHNYGDLLARLGNAATAQIERWYRRDFKLIGFRSLSRTSHTDDTASSWVVRACTPIASVTSTSAAAPAFDVASWPSPLVCRPRASSVGNSRAVLTKANSPNIS